MDYIKIKIFIVLILLLSSCDIGKHMVLPNTELDLIEFNNLHLLRITLKGKPALVLIDSGSTKSLLDINKAEEYGFDYIKINEQYIGIGGKQDIYVIFEYYEPTLDGNVFIRFLGADLDGITDYFIENNIPIIGIIGSDFLQDYRVILDFKRNKLILKSIIY